ncbi:MAG: hypothetical protein KAI84_19605 [Gammaproteobacteria bacterium]|nr:hypothetical protein [Gammaproteobacteria bacterium]
MRKSELNEIIENKIIELDDSQSMKEFLIKILNIERQNTVYSKPQYTKDYINLATDLSRKEGDI